MVECPNCGQANPDSRAFCNVCGERLPAPVPEPQTVEASPNGLQPEAPAPEPEPTSRRARGERSPSPTVAEAASHLPAWLRGAEVPPAPAAPPASEWDDDLDFSDLPGWPAEERSPAPKVAGRAAWRDVWQETAERAPEPEGTGLLAGVRGPIPIEPVITLPHQAPPFPSRDVSDDLDTGGNLFAQIAGGAIAPAPVALPKAAPRGLALFNLLLLAAVIVPLALRVSLFGPPAALPEARAYADVIASLPPGSTVLMAFDYEGGMVDEVEPAAIATLNDLRARSAEQPFRVQAVSLSPQGPALAERAWASSAGAEAGWQNLGFLAGGPIALRSLLDEGALAGEGSAAPTALIVLGNDSGDVQRWLEQVGAHRPALPLLAAVPAQAEAALMPFLASGQLDGLLAGTPGTASYGALLGDTTAPTMAPQRLDALSLAALLALAAIVVGNVVGLRRWW